MGMNRTWWSVASNIDELKALSAKLETDDGGQKARTLSVKMLAAIPRFEATEEVRTKHASMSPGLIEYRNESAASTDKCESSNSSGPSLDFQCTRVELEGNG